MRFSSFFSFFRAFYLFLVFSVLSSVLYFIEKDVFMTFNIDTPIPNEAPDFFHVFINGELNSACDTVEGLVVLLKSNSVDAEVIEDIRHLGRLYDDGTIKVIPRLFHNEDYFIELYSDMPVLS